MFKDFLVALIVVILSSVFFMIALGVVWLCICAQMFFWNDLLKMPAMNEYQGLLVWLMWWIISHRILATTREAVS